MTSQWNAEHNERRGAMQWLSLAAEVLNLRVRYVDRTHSREHDSIALGLSKRQRLAPPDVQALKINAC